MEVQADVQKERCSLSGESATVSLGTMSDNASTKAMAGSILNAYMPLERSAVQVFLGPLARNLVVTIIYSAANPFWDDCLGFHVRHACDQIALSSYSLFILSHFILQRQQSGGSGRCGV